MIVEPLVQGAAGIRVQPPGYLRRVRELCDRHDVLLICDEVATGFGRTGTMFACEQERVAPDFLCLGKGLTGGYLPLAATLDHRAGLRGLPRRAPRTSAPSSTATPSPATRSPARPRSPASTPSRARATLLRLQPKIRLLGELLAEVAEMPEVAEVRGRGFMVGIDLGEHDPALRLGHRVVARGPRARRDHPPARRRDRADAAAGDQQGGPAAAGRDRRGVDPRRVRRCVRRGARDRGARPSRTPKSCPSRARRSPRGWATRRPVPILGVMKGARGRSTGVDGDGWPHQQRRLPSDADAAFEELYRRSRDDVYAYVAGLLRDRSAAEDVTALAFERAYRRRRTFNPERGSRRAWLFGIARNAALDELRRRRRQCAARRRARRREPRPARRGRRGRAPPRGAPRLRWRSWLRASASWWR